MPRPKKVDEAAEALADLQELLKVFTKMDRPQRKGLLGLLGQLRVGPRPGRKPGNGGDPQAVKPAPVKRRRRNDATDLDTKADITH